MDAVVLNSRNGRQKVMFAYNESAIWEIRLMLIVSIVATLWYSAPQLRHTLSFPYHLLNTFFPGLTTLLPF
jgi:hypothetical protein